MAKYAIRRPCGSNKCAGRAVVGANKYGLTDASGAPCCCGGGCVVDCCPEVNEFCGKHRVPTLISYGTEAVFTETGTSFYGQQLGQFSLGHTQSTAITQTWSFSYKWSKPPGPCVQRTARCIAINWQQTRVDVSDGITTTTNNSFTSCAQVSGGRDYLTNSANFFELQSGSGGIPFGGQLHADPYDANLPSGFFDYDTDCVKSVPVFLDRPFYGQPIGNINIAVQTGCKVFDISILHPQFTYTYPDGDTYAGSSSFHIRRDMVVTKDCNGNPVTGLGGGSGGLETASGQLVVAGGFF